MTAERYWCLHADQRATYAEDLLAHSAALVVAVHDEGPDETRRCIRAALNVPAPPDADPVEALLTIMAAQIPPDARHSQLLGWTRAFRGPVRVGNEITDAAGEPDVHAVIAGLVPASEVPEHLREEAVAVLDERGGLTVDEVAARVGVSGRTVQRMRRRRAEQNAQEPATASALSAPSSNTGRAA